MLCILFGGNMSVAIILQSTTHKNVEAYNMVICADGAGNNMNCDVVIGDMDSNIHFKEATIVTNTNEYGGSTRIHNGIKLIENPCQNTTDFQKCLNFIKDKHYTIVHVYGGLSGRLDHTLNVLHTLHRYTLPGTVIVYDKGNTIHVLTSGHHCFAFTDFEELSLGLYSLEPVCVVTTGLEWNIDGIVSISDFISTSNKCKSDFTITCKSKVFLTASIVN